MSDLVSIDRSICKMLDALGQSPSIDNMRLLACEYCNLLAFLSQNYDEFSVCECMGCIEALGYRDRDFELGVARQISNLLYHQRDRVSPPILDIFFEYIIAIPKPFPESLYRSILKAFANNSRIWSSFPAFCEWWDFSNFAAGDFMPGQDIPLGCSAYLAYARAILKQYDNPHSLTFWIDFARRAALGGFSLYANLHFAEFMLRIGCAEYSVLRILRPLVVQKFRKPWVWLSVSDVFPCSDIRHKACLLFALNCTRYVDDSRCLIVFWRLANHYRMEGDSERCRYFVNRLWRSGNAYRSEILSQFPDLLDDDTHEYVPDYNFNYKDICHRIFQNISDADSALWNSIADFVSDYVLSHNTQQPGLPSPNNIKPA